MPTKDWSTGNDKPLNVRQIQLSTKIRCVLYRYSYNRCISAPASQTDKLLAFLPPLIAASTHTVNSE